MTEDEIYRKKENVLGEINETTKRIAESVGIEKIVTTGIARKTYINLLRDAGAEDHFISSNVGHHSVKTTQENYYGNYSLIKQRSWANKIASI